MAPHPQRRSTNQGTASSNIVVRVAVRATVQAWGGEKGGPIMGSAPTDRHIIMTYEANTSNAAAPSRQHTRTHMASTPSCNWLRVKRRVDDRLCDVVMVTY